MKIASVLNSLSNAVRTLAMVREAGLEPARPEWTLEPESHFGLTPSLGRA